jgi:hypothetical protein
MLLLLLQLLQLLLLRACVRARLTVIGTLRPELVLLTVPNFREYVYTKIRFSTPTLSALLPLAGQICLT